MLQRADTVKSPRLAPSMLSTSAELLARCLTQRLNMISPVVFSVPLSGGMR